MKLRQNKKGMCGGFFMRRLNAKLMSMAPIFLAAGFAGAQQMPTSPVVIAPTETSGMIGITAGQTARLNALNPGVPAPYATGALCSIQVSFLDAQGNVLQTTPVTVVPGKSMPVDLAVTTSGRTEIRAAITFTQPTPATNSSTAPPALVVPLVCPLIPTLEVFDTNTSATLAVLTEFHFTSYPLLGGVMPGVMGRL
jgi:hypothetical protein